MKRIIGYTLLILQIIFLTVVVFQLEAIDKDSEEITLLTSQNDYFYDEEYFLMDDMYVEYDVNKVKVSAWEIEEELSANHPVFVTLTKNDEGLHEVKMVTKKKPKQVEAEEVVVKAKYGYKDDVAGYYYVTYGFESLQNVEEFGSFKMKEQLRITILIGKWNQYKLSDIEAE